MYIIILIILQFTTRIFIFINTVDIDLVNFPKASQHTSLTFKLVVNSKDDGTSNKVILLAASASDKAAWTSDISQVTHFFYITTL